MSQSKFSRQAGIVSIMVTMVLMVVISMIVLGLAEVTRRDQRASLDRRLSEQAFLAAESGINDARKRIADILAGGGTIPAKTDCPTSTTDTNYPLDSNIDTTSKVSYTCLIITPELGDLQANVPKNDSVSLPMEPSGGTIGRILVRWSRAPTPGSVTGCPGAIPPSQSLKSVTGGTWTCPYGILRMDLVPTTVLTRTAMEAGQRTIFFYPLNLSGSSNVDWATADGRIAPMHCTTTVCQADISNLLPSNTKYMVRVSSVYAGGDIRLIGLDSVTNLPLGMINSQVMIDVTGRAQDVLRRVQVRVPITNTAGQTPGFALESASSICKRFESTGTTITNASDIQGQDPNNPMCN